MMKRGVLFLVWGETKEQALHRSIESLQKYHPELPVHVEKLPEGSTFLDKSRIASFTPFESTLFLDIDTVVLGRLDFAFQKAEQFGLACCICECPWANRYGDPRLNGETIEYNTGVLFFTAKSDAVFEEWDVTSHKIDSSIIHVVQGDQLAKMPENDQASFALAIEKTVFCPFVLPLNWNFRPAWQKTFYGPIKIWHDYGEVPDSVLRANRYFSEPNSVVQHVQWDKD